MQIVPIELLILVTLAVFCPKWWSRRLLWCIFFPLIPIFISAWTNLIFAKDFDFIFCAFWPIDYGKIFYWIVAIAIIIRCCNSRSVAILFALLIYAPTTMVIADKMVESVEREIHPHYHGG